MHGERLSKIRRSKIPKVAGGRYAFHWQPVFVFTESEKASYMSRLLRYYFPALIIVGLLSLGSMAQAGWQPYTDEEAGFTVSFPGKPTYEEMNHPQSGEPQETYKFHYGESFLRVTFVSLPKAPRNSAELNRAYAEITKDFSGTGILVRQEKLPDGGRQYYNIVNQPNGRLHMLTRNYIHRGRHYQLVCGTFAPTGIDEQVANRFFSSFRFIDTPSNSQPSVKDHLPAGSNLREVTRSRWYLLRGFDGDFSAEFPDTPEYVVAPQPETATEVYKYRFFFGEILFVLSYWDAPEAKARPEQSLQRIVRAHIGGEQARGEVLKQVRLPDGGYEVESRGVFNGGLFYSRVRFYVHGARVYTLTAMIPNAPGPNEYVIDRFFASFHFNKP
jgi:hypothetical protein